MTLRIKLDENIPIKALRELRRLGHDVETAEAEGLAGAARRVPRMSYRDMAADPRLRMAVGVWLVTNIVFALAAPWMGIEGGIAWEAHVGGFLGGLLAFYLVLAWRMRKG